MQHKKKKGFVLVVVVMGIALAMTIGTQLLYRGYAYTTTIPLLIRREQARMLAWSGVQIACAQLTLKDKTLVPAPNASKEDKLQRFKDFFKTLLSINNVWQTFELTKARDGVEGSIDVYVSCENGKINFNTIYDFQQHTYIKSGARDCQALIKFVGERVEKLFPSSKFFDTVTEYFKHRKGSLPDLTLILDRPEFAFLKDSFFKGKPRSFAQQPMYIDDLFTIWPEESLNINPWLLSPAVKYILDLPQSSLNRSLYDEETISSYMSKINSGYFSWQKDWSTYLQPLYGKDFASLSPIVTPFFGSTFEADLFSVVCYGKVSEIEQRVVAIVERTVQNNVRRLEIKKVYWV